jgi:hypothetical protein
MARSKSEDTSKKPAAKPSANPNPPAKTPAVKPPADTGEKGGGAKSLLDRLKSKVKAEAPKPAAKGKDKPTLRLEGSDADTFERLAAADQILKIAESGKESAKADATQIVKQRFLQMCLERGSKPDNPKLSSAHASGNFVIKHVKKLKLTGPAGQVFTVGQQLRQLGFGDSVIDKVEQKAVKEKEVMGLRSFTDLTEGNEAQPATAAEQAVAEKLLNFVLSELTDEEQALVLTKTVTMFADEGWQNLAIQIALDESAGDMAKGVEILDKLFTVIKPQFVFSQMSFTGKLESILTAMQTAPATKKEIKSPDGKYVARTEGPKVSLYLVKPDGEEFVGTKNCDNDGHAEASARKWFRPDNTSLSDFLAEAATAKK